MKVLSMIRRAFFTISKELFGFFTGHVTAAPRILYLYGALVLLKTLIPWRKRAEALETYHMNRD